MNRSDRSDAANRLERLLRRDLDEAAREAGPPSADDIDAYVAGRASAVEREVIESWLAEDAALQQEVEGLMAMRQAIEGEAGAAARATAATTATAPTPREAPGSTSASAGARTPSKSSAQTRPSAPTAVGETARQMRAQPLRTAALLAIAASLAFFVLWVASPGRPPADSKLASGGGAATSGGGSATTGRARSGAASPGGAPGAPVATATLTLRDAGGEVSLLANGDIRGLEGLDASNRSAIARTLATGRLDTSPQIDALASSASVLRSPGDPTAPPATALRVLKPFATVVRTPRPTFEWTAVPGATSYRVRIADAALDSVAESPTLTTTTWTPAPEAPLPSGRILMWQVEAQTPRGAIVAPVPPASEARIVILPAPDAEALTRALNTANGSDLAAAITLARFGILDEADAALARLAAANPNTDAIVRLRQQLSNRRFPR